ncbi:MAG: glutamine amidotransferase [Streptosporangiales bacterium]|nr:glutamine amidotransferase [Streptosporangiales bacterium]
MCGIVGLHLKNSNLYTQLGELLTPMLDRMTSRGPDSAGIALYDAPLPEGALRYSVRVGGSDAVEWDELAQGLAAELGVEVTAEPRAGGASLVAHGEAGPFLTALRALAPEVVLVGYGRAMEIYKDVGAPVEICDRYGVPKRSGYQGVGHTRMATESAVTTDGSHPFAPAADLALVHNGSFSNYASVRRRLARAGIRCETDNDSEVAARFIAHQMSLGADLEEALRLTLKELDGFFTLLVTTATEFAVVRDSFACKPAVIAETDDYVAMASEYQALTGLPGIGDAEVFEPMPEEIHAWTR